MLCLVHAHSNLCAPLHDIDTLSVQKQVRLAPINKLLTQTLCVLSGNAPGYYFTMGQDGLTPTAVFCPVNTYSTGYMKQSACAPCSPGYTTNGTTTNVSPAACCKCNLSSNAWLGFYHTCTERVGLFPIYAMSGWGVCPHKH